MCHCRKCRNKSKDKYKDKCKKNKHCCPPVPPVPTVPPKNKITFIEPFFASTIDPKVKTQIIVTGNDMASWLTTNNDLISNSITTDNFDLLNPLVDSSPFEIGIFSDCEDLEGYLWCTYYASKNFINPTKSQITEAATLSGPTQGTLHALSGSTSNPENIFNYAVTETEKLSTGIINPTLIVIQKKRA